MEPAGWLWSVAAYHKQASLVRILQLTARKLPFAETIMNFRIFPWLVLKGIVVTTGHSFSFFPGVEKPNGSQRRLGSQATAAQRAELLWLLAPLLRWAEGAQGHGATTSGLLHAHVAAAGAALDLELGQLGPSGSWRVGSSWNK